MGLKRMLSVNDHLQVCLKEMQELESGEEFMVRDLWKGYQWNRLPKADRLMLGRFFYDTVTKQNPCPVEVLDKSASNQQKYRKR